MGSARGPHSVRDDRLRGRWLGCQGALWAGTLPRSSQAGAFCAPSLARLAAEMGTSVDTIGRQLGELVEHRFIERRRRGRGAAEIIFLPHPCLTHNSADLRIRAPTPHNCGIKSKLQLRNPAVTIPQLCGSLIRNKLTREIIQEIDDDDAARDSAELQSREENLPEGLAEGLDWLDSEAPRLLWIGCRAAAPDCTVDEIVAAVQQKLRDTRGQARPGLLITAVPMMFQGTRGFHLRMRERIAKQRVQEHDAREDHRRELLCVANNPAAPESDRRWARELLEASEAA